MRPVVKSSKVEGDEKSAGKRPESSRQKRSSLKFWALLVVFLVVASTSVNHVFRDERSGESKNGDNHCGRLSVEEIEVIEPDENWASNLQSLGLKQDSPIRVFRYKGASPRKLHGRFLHITDMHPDPYYKEGSSISRVCHRGKPKDEKDSAARFGDATAGCDSSMDLMNYTLKWIVDNLRDKIDFIVWTGDNIRHDNDRNVPRTEAQIFDVNEQVSHLFEKLFGKHDSIDPHDFDVPVVPSIGNNDVFPHNLFSLGPTLQTRELYNIWSSFIPQEQQRAFARGASFFVEVIPGKLAVLSINTLYLYKANPLVDNCNGKKQPGYQLLLWFGYILEELRSRGMKVWLSGHVPPILKNFDQSCYDKFTLWTHEYRDIIIGGLYGHMNMDHFVPVNSKKAWKSVTEQSLALAQADEISQSEKDSELDDENWIGDAAAASDARLMGAKPVNKENYMDAVRETYYNNIASKMNKQTSVVVEEQEDLMNVEKKVKCQGKKHKKKKGKKKKGKDEKFSSEDYCIVNIATSVIPTFNPGFRVWEYNLTGLEDMSETKIYKPWNQFFEKLEEKIEAELEDDLAPNGRLGTFPLLFSNERQKKPERNPDKSIPSKMPKDRKLGPGYEPQLFSPTRYVQYYANLEKIDKDYQKALKNHLDPDEAASQAFKYEVEYTSDSEPYPMPSLLTRDYLELARMLSEDDRIWQTFVARAFSLSGYRDE
ncbi:LAMI_0G10990g1_1 [Lachancea mirantina]|uniref:Endopolyphosphatase n=1 Tax=Lachancea mirantina TaxID=1230905 RepID=A0A1G4KAZ7_9SACH|nr:LAMI_0G10990g1_1 [Lachancea mirantina]